MRRPGFSVGELLTVVFILSLLAIIALMSLRGVGNRRDNLIRKNDMAGVRTALDQFYADYRVLPNYSYSLATSASPNYGIDLLGKAQSCGLSILVGNNGGLSAGFVNMQNTLNCLGYTNKYIADPVNVDRGSLADDTRYFYFVNHVNTLYKLSVALYGYDVLKNTGDEGLDTVRYEVGTGKALPQFCDGFNADGLCTLVSRTYVYQCSKNSAGTDLSFAKREEYDPVTSACQTTVAAEVF